MLDVPFFGRSDHGLISRRRLLDVLIGRFSVTCSFGRAHTYTNAMDRYMDVANRYRSMGAGSILIYDVRHCTYIMMQRMT